MADPLALVLGYLAGSILPAYLIGRMRGIDVRRAGDGNPGATNALALFGPVPGYGTLAFDMLKGPLAVALGFALGAGDWAAYGAGLTALLGHRYPPYLRLRGGRGFGTAAGLLVFGLGHAVIAGHLPWPDAVALLAAYLVLWRLFDDRAVPDVAVVPIGLLDLAVRGAPLPLSVTLGAVGSYVWVFNLRRVLTEGLLLRPRARGRTGA